MLAAGNITVAFININATTTYNISIRLVPQHSAQTQTQAHAQAQARAQNHTQTLALARTPTKTHKQARTSTGWRQEYHFSAPSGLLSRDIAVNGVTLALDGEAGKLPFAA